mmetsp:Transcript_42759/g.107923  ORF Transcript_42759/g.107923 Transcript_42759/m.107923 type:complete len:331 (-) Transcript_42759:716-1708(-)
MISCSSTRVSFPSSAPTARIGFWTTRISPFVLFLLESEASSHRIPSLVREVKNIIVPRYYTEPQTNKQSNHCSRKQYLCSGNEHSEHLIQRTISKKKRDRLGATESHHFLEHHDVAFVQRTIVVIVIIIVVIMIIVVAIIIAIIAQGTTREHKLWRLPCVKVEGPCRVQRGRIVEQRSKCSVFRPEHHVARVEVTQDSIARSMHLCVRLLGHVGLHVRILLRTRALPLETVNAHQFADRICPHLHPERVRMRTEEVSHQVNQLHVDKFKVIRERLIQGGRDHGRTLTLDLSGSIQLGREPARVYKSSTVNGDSGAAVATAAHHMEQESLQ